MRSIALSFALLTTAALGLACSPATAPGTAATGSPVASAPTAGATVQPTSTESPSSTATLPASDATAAPAATTQATAVTNATGASPRVQLVQVVDGLQQPLYATHAADGSGDMYVVEKAGTIERVRNGQAAGQVMDISGRVLSSGSEQGLLGLAFHPDFARNGYFYVNYTTGSNAGQTVISRFTMDLASRRGNTETELRLLTFTQPFTNHNGGQLAFGPDGYLYIATGDGGSSGDPQGNGQRLDTLLGKILRIDVNRTSGNTPYAIPADNPFAGRQGARPENWAYGLRNPWRFSFDRATDDLWIADVGQNRLEEIDRMAAPLRGGQNFGWDTQEGSECFSGSSCDRSGLVQPVAEYGRSEGCSVTGGYVYRGQQFAQMAGRYYFTDYCSGIVWSLTRNGDAWQRTEVLGRGLAGLSSFGTDEAGELYVTNLNNGRLYRVQPAG